MKRNKTYPKTYPSVEKAIDKDGKPVHREYHLLHDITLPTKEEFEETHLKVLLKITPKSDLEALEKHYKGSTNTSKNKKAVYDIEPEIPEWTQALVALRCLYHKTDIKESNREAIAKQYKKADGQSVSGSQELVKLQNNLKTNIDIYKKSIDPRYKPEVEKILNKLQKLRLIMEDHGEKGSGAYETLLSDIETLEKNIKK
jgi:hypothetical protein